MVCQSKLFVAENGKMVKLRRKFICSVRWNKIPNPEALGNFELLIDEELAAQDDVNSNKDKSKTSGYSTHNRWK